MIQKKFFSFVAAHIISTAVVAAGYIHVHGTIMYMHQTSVSLANLLVLLTQMKQVRVMFTIFEVFDQLIEFTIFIQFISLMN